MSKEIFDVRPVTLDVINNYHFRTLEKNISIKFDFPDNPCPIYADTNATCQILDNILSNAIKYSQPDSKPIQVSYKRRESYAVIRITDFGIGIPQAELAHIFEPFYTTKDVGQGTGLGLSVSYGLVRRYGGDITVSSEPGRGTVFEVRLPLG